MTILSFATVLCFLITSTMAVATTTADSGFTVRGTVATGVAGAGAGITVVGADGTALTQTATAGSDGTYSITFSSTPTFPIQINASVNGQTMSNLATSTSSTNRNINQVTSAATDSAIATGGSLASVTETSLNSAGQTILGSALGGGVTYASFGTAAFTARTDAADYTQTASVTDVFLDTLGELATTGSSTVSALLTTQTTPLLETDSFAVNAAENLALVDTTDTVSSVITGGTKAQAVDSVATSIRAVVTTIGTKDKTAVGAARAVGAAIASSISSSTGLTSSSELSNLANNVTLLVQASVISFVQSAGTLTAAEIATLAETLGTSQGTALQTVNLTSSAFTATQVSTDLASLTTSLAAIGTAVEGTAAKVAGGTSVTTALAEDAATIATVTTKATTTASTTINTTNTTPQLLTGSGSSGGGSAYNN